MTRKQLVLTIAAGFTALVFSTGIVRAQDVVWKLNSLSFDGSTKPEILGAPVVKKDSGYDAIVFNGAGDGMIIPGTPVEGWKQFTIEVLVKPDGDGPKAPRFIHFQDADGNRGTFEMRLTPQKQWYLDEFLKNGKAGDKGLALIDSTQLHPTDHWYWIAMVFDGKTMTSYVNGVKQKDGLSNFPVLNAAPLALGVRLNKVSWFKGMISEVRFHQGVLKQSELQREKQ